MFDGRSALEGGGSGYRMGRVAAVLGCIAVFALCQWGVSSLEDEVVATVEVLDSEQLELPENGAAYYPIVEVRGPAGRPTRQTVRDPAAGRATPWPAGEAIVVRYRRERWQHVRLAPGPR